VITEIADAGLHILYGALIWVCTLAAIAALTLEAAAYAVYRAFKAWRARRRRSTPAWAHTQPLAYEEAA